MSIERGPAITGIGMDVPPLVVTNDQLIRERGLDTSDKWIIKNTGIRRRHIALLEQSTSDFATAAAAGALAMAQLEPREVKEIIVATATPDMIFPSTACRVQDNLGATRAAAYDLSVACSGAVYGLANAYAMLKAGMQENSVVIGAETFSRVVDPNDRGTAILFGDGAGAVVVQNVEQPGLAYFVRGSDGSKGDLLMIPAGGSRFPASRETVEAGMHYVKMKGHDVFKEAVTKMTEVSIEVLNRAGLTDAHGGVDPTKIDLVIPHQANQRIMDRVGKKLGIPSEKLYSNIAEYGNTSAASIFIAMYEAYHKGKIQKGDTLLLVAFGGGFTYGAGVIQWHLETLHRTLIDKIFHR